MTRNLPDDVRPSDIDGRGNHPPSEPAGYCPHCRSPYGYLNDQRRIDHSRFETIVHELCNSCDEVYSARLVDETEVYLLEWRFRPEEMEPTIERYSELRTIA